MTQELKNLVEEAKALNNNELNALVIATIHMQKKVLGYGRKVPTTEEQENIGEICKNTIRGLIDKYKKKQEERNKELSLSLSIATYLNILDDIMFAKGMLVGGKDHKGIHDCMKMWQKLHNRYFYSNDTGYEPQQQTNDIDISELEWFDVETDECPCYSCELFDRKNNECKDISLCKMPKNSHKGFYVM